MQTKVLFLCLFLGACHSSGIQTINIPVPVRTEPASELLAPFSSPPPVFISPIDPNASSCLSPEGEKQLQAVVHEMVTRQRAWREFTAD